MILTSIYIFFFTLGIIISIGCLLRSLVIDPIPLASYILIHMDWSDNNKVSFSLQWLFCPTLIYWIIPFPHWCKTLPPLDTKLPKHTWWTSGLCSVPLAYPCQHCINSCCSMEISLLFQKCHEQNKPHIYTISWINSSLSSFKEHSVTVAGTE